MSQRNGAQNDNGGDDHYFATDAGENSGCLSRIQHQADRSEKRALVFTVGRCDRTTCLQEIVVPEYCVRQAHGSVHRYESICDPFGNGYGFTITIQDADVMDVWAFGQTHYQSLEGFAVLVHKFRSGGNYQVPDKCLGLAAVFPVEGVTRDDVKKPSADHCRRQDHHRQDED